MDTYNFQIIRRKKNNTTSYSSLIMNRRYILYPGFLLLCCIFCLSAISQTRTFKTEVIEHASIDSLKNTKKQSTRYQASVISAIKNEAVKKQLSRDHVPFYPYVNINLDKQFLPVAPFRIYLGKISDVSKLNVNKSLVNIHPDIFNDFILIVVPCKDSNGTSESGSQSKYKYTDAIESRTLATTVSTPVLYYIRQDSINPRQDRIIYLQITRGSAMEYIGHFKNFTRKNNLSNRYPTCVVLEKNKSASNRIKLQPVITTRWNGSNIGNGGAKSVSAINRFFFQLNYSFQDGDGQQSVCCEAPPENGNSMH